VGQTGADANQLAWSDGDPVFSDAGPRCRAALRPEELVLDAGAVGEIKQYLLTAVRHIVSVYFPNEDLQNAEWGFEPRRGAVADRLVRAAPAPDLFIGIINREALEP
jgi:hypothetical protein